MSGFPILSTITFLPACGALLILLVRSVGAKRSDGAAMVSGVLVSLVNFALSLWALVSYDSEAGGFQLVEKSAWVGGLSYHFGVDGMALLLVVLTAGLVPMCLVASWGSVRHRVTEYVIAFLVLETLMIGVFCSLDLVLFYIFFEGGLIPMFVIIGVWGGADRFYAAFKFFLYTLLGSLFLLLAVIYMYATTGTGDIVQLHRTDFPTGVQKWLWLAFFASFAVKLPMWPFHTWLPDAHVQAPTAGSVILAGVLLKMGGYGFLRFSLPMFPDASVFFQPLVFALSVIAIIYASLVAFRQTDIKKLIAYSSVAHMGYVTLGIFAFNATGVQGAIFQMFSHGLISSALFLSVGVLYERARTRDLDYFGGLASRMPVFAIALMVLTMANVGLPGTSGFIGEILSITGGVTASAWAGGLAASGVIFSAVYMLSMYRQVMLGELTNEKLNGLSDLDTRELFILVVMCVLVLLFGVFPSGVFDLTGQSAAYIIDSLSMGR